MDGWEILLVAYASGATGYLIHGIVDYVKRKTKA